MIPPLVDTASNQSTSHVGSTVTVYFHLVPVSVCPLQPPESSHTLVYLNDRTGLTAFLCPLWLLCNSLHAAGSSQRLFLKTDHGPRLLNTGRLFLIALKMKCKEPAQSTSAVFQQFTSSFLPRDPWNVLPEAPPMVSSPRHFWVRSHATRSLPSSLPPDPLPRPPTWGDPAPHKPAPSRPFLPFPSGLFFLENNVEPDFINLLI